MVKHFAARLLEILDLLEKLDTHCPILSVITSLAHLSRIISSQVFLGCTINIDFDPTRIWWKPSNIHRSKSNCALISKDCSLVKLKCDRERLNIELVKIYP